MRDVSQARPWAIRVVANAKIRHRALVILTVSVAVILAVSLAAYGWKYYTLAQVERPYSHMHRQLKPSGSIGLKLGMLGLFLFALVYLYPLRKRWTWLGRQGKTSHWFDFHMILGLVAPVVITFHSAFKIQGFAGMAWWTMLALVISGLVGRYFYSQIPRKLDAATLTMNEMQELSRRLIEELNSQNVFDPSDVARLFRMPDIQQVQQMSIIKALFQMVVLDLARPFKMWSLRRHREGSWGKILTFGGILHTRRDDLEEAIRLVSKQASIAKKILFISKAERVFFLWHVIHRPFSLSFAIFVVIHVAVVVSLGYF